MQIKSTQSLMHTDNNVEKGGAAWGLGGGDEVGGKWGTSVIVSTIIEKKLSVSEVKLKHYYLEVFGITY